MIRLSGLGQSELLQWVRAANGREFLAWTEEETTGSWHVRVAETCTTFSNTDVSGVQTPGALRDVQAFESGMPKIALDNVNNFVHVVWAEYTDPQPGASTSGVVWRAWKEFSNCP